MGCAYPTLPFPVACSKEVPCNYPQLEGLLVL